VLCFYAAAGLFVLSGVALWLKYTVASIALGVVAAVSLWASLMYGRESQQEVAIVVRNPCVAMATPALLPSPCASHVGGAHARRFADGRIQGPHCVHGHRRRRQGGPGGMGTVCVRRHCRLSNVSLRPAVPRLVQTSLIKALLGIERGEDSDRNRALVVGLASDRREPVEVDIGVFHVTVVWPGRHVLGCVRGW
jgi:hypothetical protein